MRQPDLSFLVQRQESLGDDAPLPLLPQEPSFAPLEAVEAAAQLPQDDPLAILIAELRNYQAELEVQNQVLNNSQAVAESASERFEALFASVPLPLLVLDDAHDMVIQANAMALNAFQPQGSDRLLASFMPFVCPADRDRVQQAFTLARSQGKSEVHEMVFNLGNRSTMQGDLHIACIEVPRQDGPPHGAIHVRHHRPGAAAGRAAHPAAAQCPAAGQRKTAGGGDQRLDGCHHQRG